MSDLTFVFEVCGQCSQHQWNTRHDEARYEGAFQQVQAAIKEVIPNAKCQMNKVPKPWFEKELYCQLIPNEDDNNPNYDMLPRLGAFEVSTVHDNADILFYSKMMSSMWPNASALAKRIKEFADETKTLKGAELQAKYKTSGRQHRQARQRGESGFAPMTSSGSVKSIQVIQEKAAENFDPETPPKAKEAEPVKEEKKAEPVKEEVKQPEPVVEEKAPAKEEAPVKEAAPVQAPVEEEKKQPEPALVAMGEQAAPPVEPALKADIEAFCDKEFAIWLADSTQAQKDSGDAEMEKFMTDPEFGASEMAKMNADFAIADVNKDGKLDIAEFKTFIAKMKADEVAKGGFWNPIDTTEEMYALHNRHSKEDGVTLAEFEATMGVWMEKWGPMREASRAK